MIKLNVVGALSVLTFTHAAQAGGCNVSDVLFGKVRIELIPQKGYETGIIFGDDFDSARFSYYKIVGQVAAPERDGSRKVTNANGDYCGVIESSMKIETDPSSCGACVKTPLSIRSVTPMSFAVLLGNQIVGTVRGRLPNLGRRKRGPEDAE